MADKPTPRATPPHAEGTITPGAMLYADMRRRTEQLKRDLGPIMYDAQASIEEEAFKRYFLPLFAGDYSKDRDKYTEAMTGWFRVAGNPYSAVSVILGGQVVAVVPPVRSNILSGKPSESFQDIGSILKDVENYATLSPSGAQDMLVTVLHRRYMTKIPRPNLTREERAWFDLLNRYGRAPASMLTGQEEGSTLIAPAVDDFDYE